MISLFLRNTAAHPTSHSLPMDSKDPDAKEGKMWASVAEVGRVGICKCAVCVDVMCSPFGKTATIGVFAGLMLVNRMFVCTKWFFDI